MTEKNEKILTKRLAELIEMSSNGGARIMHTSGMQTASALMGGIRDLLPSKVSLVSGPGCPASVLATTEIDRALKLCVERDVIVAAFGNLMRVPGSYSSLEAERKNGADVREVDSAFEAVRFAAEARDRKVVLIGTGFEATASTVAAAILEAKKQRLKNFRVFSLHRLLLPALDTVLSDEDLEVDGVLCPGHISAVIGANAFIPIAAKNGIPCVISGLSPTDILHSIHMLIDQKNQGKARVQNQFKSAVTSGGNRTAISALEKVFRPSDTHWRGLGSIPKSGLTLRLEFKSFRAESAFDLSIPEMEEHSRCICGDILAAAKNPLECPLFDSKCSPEHPVGPSMASAEAPCSAFHAYHAMRTLETSQSAA